MRTLDASTVSHGDLDELSTLTDRLPEHSPLREFLQQLRDTVAAGTDVTVAAATKQMTPAAAAKLIGVSRGHVYKLMDTGHLPFVRVGNDRRTTLAEVEAFLQTQEDARREMAHRAAHPDVTRAAALQEYAAHS